MNAVTDCSLEIPAGGITALIGGNGAGKTTSVKMIAGALRPRSGSITFDGVDIASSPAHETVELGLALVPEGRLVFQYLTVLENLLISGHVRRGRASLQSNLERVFDLFPRLGERRSQNAGSLSGGEQQMLAIGRGLMTNPRLLILDEPSLGLSPILVSSIFSLVRKLNEESISVLLVEQNVHHTLAIADYGYVLEKGRVVQHGEGSSLLADPKVKEAYLGFA
ncbi:ABC transporter ATP-binding protein [Nitratireductor aquimarinus]|nr:ABC transporter ATP-binding protein [Nitratireductor aquimarinus]MBN8245686.1 ABC transporter ATP-binding protein [Nitratireductor aquimarinus]MBY6134069.1 ABC transporter ATP-binding protein [Nitratireductor aquimarinus]MCA1305165.1 ABC transporter ATP-binding protein [Nitratireductor aquimarinus]